MDRNRASRIALSGVLIAGLAFAQNDGKASPSDPKQTVRVGIAVPTNRSGRPVTPVWERDQFVRELRRKRTDRKSQVVLEAISLEAVSKEDAIREAEQKRCQYVVLTSLVNGNQGSGVPGVPGGSSVPAVVGNVRPGRAFAVDFTIVDVVDVRTIAEDTATATVEGTDDTRAADEAIRMAAHRVASELRADRPPKIE